MKFFLPDWEDRIDPGFDFIRDSYSKSHISNPYFNDVYAHQIYDSLLPYDGVLISLSIFRSKLRLKNHGSNDISIRDIRSIKDYLKIPKNSKLEVLGDCGAFSYANEKDPPSFFNTDNVASIYEKLGFDYGVSVDHMALDRIYVRNVTTRKKELIEIDPHETKRRVRLTIDNAQKFLEIHNEKHYHFIPIGVAQGYNKESYASSVRLLVNMGYDYIGVGSLVRYTSNEILSILERIKPELGSAKLHLFGVLRPPYIKRFEALGAVSFDSASYMRKAWLRSGNNYLSSDNNWYAALRVPYSNNPVLKKKSLEVGIDEKTLKRLEMSALKALREYDSGQLEINKTLKIVMKYDNLLTRNSSDGLNLEQRYRKTLEEKPWKRCGCSVCRDVGIDMLIFRGTNRNKRRGFHNIWVFRNSKDFLSLLSDEKG